MTYKLDLFAIFIFLGIVQAIFLSVFFLSKEHRKVQANVFTGLMLLTLAANNLEIFLMYSGYIINCLYLVDFSEPFAFLIGPLFYLIVLSTTRGTITKIQYLHFVFALIYFLLVIPFFVLPEDVKYNSWIESYKVNLPLRDYNYDRNDPRSFWITDHHTLLVICSMSLYAILAMVEVIRVFREKNESFFKPVNSVLGALRNGIFQIVFSIMLILVVKHFNPNDTGDHVFAAYFAIIIYLMSFRVMRQSGFFQRAGLQEAAKYKSSGITSEQQENMLVRLKQLMQQEKPFMKPDFSLPELAQQMSTSVHTLSQVINSGLGKSFFEMTAGYRVDEAKQLLKTRKNIKVEEIAEMVGYNSKSSFNTVFKKITGKTPSEFRTEE